TDRSTLRGSTPLASRNTARSPTTRCVRPRRWVDRSRPFLRLQTATDCHPSARSRAPAHCSPPPARARSLRRRPLPSPPHARPILRTATPHGSAPLLARCERRQSTLLILLRSARTP